jgi:hypothetical protein
MADAVHQPELDHFERLLRGILEQVGEGGSDIRTADR